MKAGQVRGRQLALFALCAILGACSGHDKPPSTVVDACRMQSERPQWFAAMRRTEGKWGVPVSVQLATIARGVELPQRRAADPQGRQRPLLARRAALQRLRLRPGDRRHLGRLPRRPPASAGADRDDFSDASDFIGWYMNTNSQVNGVPLRDTYNQYLAYHEGKAGFARGSYRGKAWLPPRRPRRRGLGRALRAAAADLLPPR